MIVVVVIIVIVVVALILGVTLRDRETTGGVDSFRRQIDALSPEARKPTVDQVKSAERSDVDTEPSAEPGDGDDTREE